jgi:lysophospholipase L1-like esterase
VNILFFGASITQGFWDTKGGFVARIRRKLDKKAIAENRMQESPFVYNLGFSGQKTGDILQRIDVELRSISLLGDSVIIFNVGTNDSQLSKTRSVYSPEQYGENLKKLHKIASNYASDVFFMEILPCDERLTVPVPWADSIYTNDRINQFNAILRDFCKENGLRLIKVSERFRAENEKRQFLIDGLHPNDAGHKFLAEWVRADLMGVIE